MLWRTDLKVCVEDVENNTCSWWVKMKLRRPRRWSGRSATALTIASKTTPLIRNSRNIRASSPRKNVVTMWFHHASLWCRTWGCVLCVSCVAGSNDASSIASRRRALASGAGLGARVCVAGVVLFAAGVFAGVVLLVVLIVSVKEFQMVI